MGDAYIENGAMRRTTCCEFFGPLLRGMSEGSKSGGKYLFNTARSSVIVVQSIPSTYLFVQTWLWHKDRVAAVLTNARLSKTRL